MSKARSQAAKNKLRKESGTATKTNPELWERSKQQAKAKMGGKHSARAMQLAAKIYKEAADTAARNLQPKPTSSRSGQSKTGGGQAGRRTRVCTCQRRRCRP